MSSLIAVPLMFTAFVFGGVSCSKVSVSTWSCKAKADLDPATRDELEQMSRKYLATLVAGDWAEAKARTQAAQHDALVSAGEGIRARWGGAGQADLSDLFLIESTGTFPIQPLCGESDRDSDNHLELAQPVVLESALAITRLTKDVGSFTYGLVIQWLREGEEWQVAHFAEQRIGYRGNDAVSLERLAQSYASKGEGMTSAILMLLAHDFSFWAPNLVLGTRNRLERERDEFLAGPVWRTTQAQWAADGLPAIIRINYLATPEEVAPTFAYVTKQPLQRPPLYTETKPLFDYVRLHHRGVVDLFSHVIFEAYHEAPKDPGKQYELFRISFPAEESVAEQ